MDLIPTSPGLDVGVVLAATGAVAGDGMNPHNPVTPRSKRRSFFTTPKKVRRSAQAVQGWRTKQRILNECITAPTTPKKKRLLSRAANQTSKPSCSKASYTPDTALFNASHQKANFKLKEKPHFDRPNKPSKHQRQEKMECEEPEDDAATVADDADSPGPQHQQQSGVYKFNESPTRRRVPVKETKRIKRRLKLEVLQIIRRTRAELRHLRDRYQHLREE